MEHHDFQAVSKMYQVPVHILTTGVQGKEEPKARWTHVEPDTMLRSFRQVEFELPDMWLMHVDNIHFDLTIRKDNDLAKEGSINTRKRNEFQKEKKAEEEEGSTDPVEEEGKEPDEPMEGPGYMGWQVEDGIETIQKIRIMKQRLKN